MTYTYTEQVTLTRITCGGCGITFAVPERFDRERQEDGGSWYCPNGHTRAYKEPKVERLGRQLASAQAALTSAEDQRRAAERSAAAARGQVTKIRKRVANGVCPCCHRTFVNVARHMAAKHPDEATAS